MDEDEDEDDALLTNSGADDAHIASLIEQYKAQGGTVGQGRHGRCRRRVPLGASASPILAALGHPHPRLSLASAADLQQGMGKLDHETYEADEAAHGDAAFYALQRRLARMPEQVGPARARALFLSLSLSLVPLARTDMRSCPSPRFCATSAKASPWWPPRSSLRRPRRHRVRAATGHASLRCSFCPARREASRSGPAVCRRRCRPT